MDMKLSKLQESLKDKGAWHAAVYGGCKELDTTEQLNWTISHFIILTFIPCACDIFSNDLFYTHVVLGPLLPGTLILGKTN